MKITSRFLLPLGLLLLGPAPAGFAAAPPPAPPLTDLVDDHTAIAIDLADIPALVQGWDNSPFARTWGDEEVVKFLAPLRTSLKLDSWDDQIKSATGKTLRELLALAKGGAIVAVPASIFTDLAENKPPVNPPILFAIELGDNTATVESLVTDAAKKNEALQVVTTNYAGVLVHSNTPPAGKDGAPGGPPVVSAMCQGDWLLSDNYDRVCAAIDAIQKGGLPNSLGKSENYLRAMQRAGDSQAVFYLDFQALYPAIVSAFDKGFASAGVPGDPDAILKAIGLDALRGMWYSASFLPKETRLTFGLNYTEDRGVVQLAAIGPGAAKLPDWMPAKFFGAASYRFDLRAAYASFESILAAASPEASKSLQDTLAEGNKQLGIDLKRDLIGSLGGDIYVGSALPADANPDAKPGLARQEQLFAISLENPETMNKAIEAIKLTAGGGDPAAVEKLFTKQDYLGQAIYTFAPPGAAPGASNYSYAIANRTLLVGVGSADPVKAAIQGMGDKPGPSFWARAEIKDALAELPPDAPIVAVSDLRVLIPEFFKLVREFPSPFPLVDDSVAPDTERIARYWGLSVGYGVKDAAGLFSVNHLINPPPQP